MKLDPFFLSFGFLSILLLAGIDLIAPVVQHIAQWIKKKILLLAVLLPLIAASQTRNVGTVKASDGDQGQVITYSITAGNTLKFFSIGSRSGLLTVKETAFATFIRQRTFKLTVKVMDDGKMYRPDGSYRQDKPAWVKATITVILKKVKTSTGAVINQTEMIYQI